MGKLVIMFIHKRKSLMKIFIITAGLLNVVSDRIYEALAHHVTSTKANNQRLKYVTLWSLQLSAKGAIQTLKNVLGQSKAT